MAYGWVLAWGVLWALAFGVTAVVISFVDPASIDPEESPLVMAAIGGAVGFVSGLGFALALSLADHGRQLARIPIGHGLACGAIGGAALPLLSSMPDGNAILTCPLGAVFGAVIIGYARSGGKPGGGSPGFLLRHVRKLVQDIAGTPLT